MAMPRMWPVLGSVGECLWLLPSIRHDHDRRRQYLSGLWEVSVRALFDGVPHPSQVSGDFVSAPTSRQAALERLSEGVKELLATDWGLPHHVETGLEAMLLNVEQATLEEQARPVEQAVPETADRLDACPRHCTVFQQYGDCDHRNPSELAAAKIALCKARVAIRAAARIITDRTELMGDTADDPLPDVRAWLALPAVKAAVKEET